MREFFCLWSFLSLLLMIFAIVGVVVDLENHDGEIKTPSSFYGLISIIVVSGLSVLINFYMCCCDKESCKSCLIISSQIFGPIHTIVLNILLFVDSR